jgi:CheY-like chemotaxis protein
VCQEYLTFKGYEVQVAYCAAQALEILDKTRVDLVITNNIMPGMTGLEFTRLLKDD